MTKIYITGISGTGKTSIAGALNDKGIKAFDIDEVPGLCDWFDRSTGQIVDHEAKLDRDFIESHKWVCDCERLRRLLDQEIVVAALGNADNKEEILPLFNKIILLRCEPEIFLSRIRQRTGNEFGQEQTAQEYLSDTYQSFESEMLKRGAERVDAGEPLEKVVEKIISKIRS